MDTPAPTLDAPSTTHSGLNLRSVFDNMSDAFISVDRNWTINFVNRSYLKLVSSIYPNEEDLLGKNLWERFPTVDTTEAGRRYQAAMQTGEADVFQYFFDPLQAWLQISVRPSEGGLAIYLQDITERKTTEAALRQSEEHYRTLFESIEEGFCVVDMIFDGEGKPYDYRFLEGNPAFEKLTGLHNTRGRTVRQMVPTIEHHWLEIYGRVATTGEPIRFVNEAKGLDERWFDVYAFRLGDRGSTQVAIIFTNITQRKTAEDRLQRRNELLSLLSESARDLLAATDAVIMVETLYGRVAERLKLDVFFNFMAEPDGTHLCLEASGGITDSTRQSLARIAFGDAICGTVALERRRIALNDVQHCSYDKATAVKSLGIRAYACHPLLVGEKLVGTLSFGSRRRDSFEDDELEFMQTIASYVATAKERLRVESELQLALQREKSASLAKDRFLAVLSHELRTPLTPVLMTAEARGMDASLPPDLREDMMMIRRNVDLETKLIDDLLDVSRITSGKLSLHPETVVLNEAVEHVCGICRPQLQEKEIRLHRDLDPAAGQITADPARLQQVLWNLVKNAVKFTPRGGDIFVKTQRLASDMVQVRVRDTGIGMTGETLPRIFDAFEQADEGITRQFGGLGLGLAISKALVELHNGAIWAESDGEGRGSCFVLELPITEPCAQAEIAEPSSSSVNHPIRRTRILLVEDHADTARTLALLLRHSGYDVDTAGNVSAALDLASRESFDLLVSDIGLPDATGYDLMRTIAERHALKGIAMSGYGMEEDIRKSREAGFSEHLVKPVDLPRLKQAIERASVAT